MAVKLKSRKELRQKRHRRVRRKIAGTAERPRMSIAVSGKHIYVQFIDDEDRKTLAAVSTVKNEGRNNLESARKLGKRAAEAAVSAGIKDVVVDRGGHAFHGRIKAVVDAVVEAGLTAGSAGEDNKEDK